MKRTAWILAYALLVLPLTATAGKVYKVVDQKGRITYTDKPPAEGINFETVDLPEPNTQPALKALKIKPVKPGSEPFGGYDTISIQTPKNEQTIPPGQMEVTVQLTLTPDLRGGHLVQLIFDGNSWGNPVPTTGFVLHDLDRGEHTIQMEIVDAKGNVVGTSNSVIIHVKRPSTLTSNIALPDPDANGDDNPNIPQKPPGFAAGKDSPFTVNAQRARRKSN